MIREETYISLYIDTKLSKRNNEHIIAWYGQYAMGEIKFAATVIGDNVSKTMLDIMAVTSIFIIIQSHQRIRLIVKNKHLIHLISECLNENIEQIYHKSMNEIEFCKLRMVHKIKKLKTANIQINTFENIYEDEEEAKVMKQEMAKLMDSPKTIYRMNNNIISRSHVYLKWNGETIVNNIRKKISEIRDQKNLDKFLNGNRDERIKYLFQTGQIDWKLTWSIWNKVDAGTYKRKIKSEYEIHQLKTSIFATKIKAFWLKLNTNELCTIERMKIRFPELYKEWKCPEQGCSELEFDEHIILCEKRLNKIKDILVEFENDLIQEIIKISKWPIEDLQDDLRKLDLCNLYDNIDDIGFLEIMRGLVPKKAVKWLRNLQLDTKDINDIMTTCFTNIIKKVYKNIWLDRCQKVVELEKANNIFKKDKRKKRERKSKYNRSIKTKENKNPKTYQGNIEGKKTYSNLARDEEKPSKEAKYVHKNKCIIN